MYIWVHLINKTMISEINEVQKYFKDKFGSTDNVPDGIYAVPTNTSKGDAFMRIEIKDKDFYGKANFMLFNDEQLTKSWY